MNTKTESPNNSNPFLSSTTHGRIAQGYILQERQRQDAKWGEQNHDPCTWVTVLTEEVGELAETCLDYVRAVKDSTHYEDEARNRLKHEAIQCAAVATAIVEWIERGAPR
jgi:NTP pyrophosphatase (non-canonical NTP hydrolase)